MKINIETILKELGLPLALVAIISGVLGLLGFSLELILSIAATLAGVASLIALVINILKVLKIVDDGTAPKWSAALNLLAFIAIPSVLKLNPDFNFAWFDAQVGEFVKVAVVIFAYVTQVFITQKVHTAFVHGLSIKPFSFSLKGSA